MGQLEGEMNKLKVQKVELEREILEKKLYREEQKVQTPQVQARVNDLQEQIKNMHDASAYVCLNRIQYSIHTYFYYREY